MTMKNDTKSEEELTCHFKMDMRITCEIDIRIKCSFSKINSAFFCLALFIPYLLSLGCISNIKLSAL